MTEYRVADVVRATSPKGTVIEGALIDLWGDPSIPFVGSTPEKAIAAGYTVELIKAAPSATRKALDDAPRNSFVRGESTSRTFWKSRNLRWYEIIHDYEGDEPKIVEANGKQMDIVADWIESLPKFTLTTPNGD